MKCFLYPLLFFVCTGLYAISENDLLENIKSNPNFVAFWDFKENDGENRIGIGKHKESFALEDFGKSIKHSGDGAFGGSAVFDGKSGYLILPKERVGKLNLTKEVTVMALINWEGKDCSFIAGLWNEYTGGGKRQYGLFASLPMYNGKGQVCGHISKNGTRTPPFPFSIDYCASGQKIPVGKWVCVAMTYDGKYIKGFLNGICEERKPELISHTKGFEGYPNGAFHSKNPYYYPDGMGDNGSDFTVGSVMLKNGMGNFFKGKIAAVAVFDKALSDGEMKMLSQIPEK